jgi:hypothetical protein
VATRTTTSVFHPVLSLGATAGWDAGFWTLGVAVAVDLPDVTHTDTARITIAASSLLVSLERAITCRRTDFPLCFAVRAKAGGLILRTTARAKADGTRDDAAALSPVVSLAGVARLTILGDLQTYLAPEVSLLPVRRTLFVDQRLAYSSDWVIPGLGFGVQAAF